MKPTTRRAARGPLTRDKLHKSALHYLERYASSVAGLRRVLLRRVDRAVQEGRCERDEAVLWVDDIVGRFENAGLVDDRTFAAGQVASRRRRGESGRRIALKLREKGVDANVVDDALLDEDGPDQTVAEFAAACRFARRRRLGPMRDPDNRISRRDRDLAALARAGFSLDVARRVLDLDDETALLENAEGPAP